MKVQNSRNKITSLCLLDGETSDQEEIKAATVDFYKNLIGSNDQDRHMAITEVIQIGLVITKEEAEEL